MFLENIFVLLSPNVGDALFYANKTDAQKHHEPATEYSQLALAGLKSKQSLFPSAPTDMGEW